MAANVVVRTHISVLLVLLAELFVNQSGLVTGAVAGAVTLAAVGAALVFCAVVAARGASPVPPARIRTALRDRERRTAFLPQCDPDASGRPRPRAPGRALPTAG
ncbi:MAG TPA: hypothetical protein DEQ61_15735 [Streptomyces sp.]|nr:hypothetical protein [Streptomyces sp.]